MKRNPTIPTNPDARCAWFENWTHEFPQLALTLGFSSTELANILVEAGWVIFSCQLAGDATSYAQACQQWRNSVLNGDTLTPVGPAPSSLPPATPVGTPTPGLIDRFRGYIRRVKASPTYTPAIGETLRIIPPPPTSVDEATIKPDLSAVAQANYKILVRWPRLGFPAVQLQGRFAEDSAWVDLGTQLESNFLDQRPTQTAGRPELVSYRAIYKRGQTEVGLWSDVVTVTKQP